MTIESIISAGLIAIFALIAYGHGYCLIRRIRKGTNFSTIPFLGGILGCIGFIHSSSSVLNHVWWLPLILDFGSIPWLLSSVFMLIGQLWTRTAH